MRSEIDARVTRPALPPGPYLVLGLGRAGEAAAAALAARGDPRAVAAWDAVSTDRTRAVARRLGALGVDADLRPAGPRADLRPRTVVRSPGFALDHPVLARLRSLGAEILDELEAGWRLAEARVLGVTGTNGKGTVCSLVTRVLAAAGHDAVTTGNWEFGPPLSAAAAAAAPGSWLVCEVSSYQLEAAPAFLPEVAVLTNLSHDHLDRHPSMRAYGDAKRRMFLRAARAAPAAVVGIDDGFGRDLAARLAGSGLAPRTFGTSADAAYRVRDCSSTLRSSVARLDTPEGPVTLRWGLPGRHNARNACAALACAATLGIDPATAAAALETASAPPGRLERVDAGQPFDVLVDYAHNPAGYRAVLETARAAAGARPGARVIAVISVATNKDALKRSAMAAAARELADLVVVTRGNRDGDEPVEDAVADLMRGARAVAGGRLELVADRAAALGRAVEQARPGDVVLVLGRGASARALDPGGAPFDDRVVLRDAIGALASQRRSPAASSTPASHARAR